ncbi:MAG: hypothetical protein C5B52_07310 [Bacteroidetes bacterium]|nr:MAG: hypothetical protein C5B52_07310 [Bacteroidota bacterium]
MKAKKMSRLLSRNYFYFSLVVLAIAVFFACVKKTDEITKPPVTPTDTVAIKPPVKDTSITPPLRCAYSPDYGDTILCGAQSVESNVDYIVTPENYPGNNIGKYVSYPDGLVLDANTGAINVTKSESGMIFHVGFVPRGTTDTCFTKIITSGITYLDGIHILADGDTLAVPVYNGNPNLKPVCGTGGFSTCSFDNATDAGGVNYTCNFKNIKIDTSTGVISLSRSLIAGLFGVLPKNGDQKTATVYYRLNDCSGMALRKMDINISYYMTLSDVPAALINDINTLQQALIKSLFGREGRDMSTNPRPPHIVIVASH